jgi:2,3-diketo-5-methylthio-1-phosphopentane phosphatase
MAILSIPDKNIIIRDVQDIRFFLNKRGIFFDQWDCNIDFDDNATQNDILNAYSREINLFKEKNNYKVADVINLTSNTENYDMIRNKFISEHIHSEDEIRFFVDGSGLFWFNLETEPIFNLFCEKGDLISVPAGTKHWFDAGISNPFVKAIRIFSDENGWVPNYTDSKTEQKYSNFKLPLKHRVNFILTDIEGTTTSISFVTNILFPYFIDNIEKLKNLYNIKEVKEAFEQTKLLAKKLDNEILNTDDEIINKLKSWAVNDKKITPLKALQGYIWEDAYKTGKIKGHVYDDVPKMLEKWKKNYKLNIGIFSSGSIAAQKQLFEYSELGNLINLFSNYFDTTTGNKRDTETYSKIASILNIKPENILFLSDIKEELIAAKEAQFQTIQLIRNSNTGSWNRTAENFYEVDNFINNLSSAT